jgi:hypothetical protein
MPTISRFFGIVITMYYDDHLRPHFHATYAEHAASIAIDDLEVLKGSLPPRKLKLVRKWAAAHRGALNVNWQRTRDELPLEPIDPLN